MVATALLDRLLLHAIVIPIEVNSYRISSNAALLPEPLRQGLDPFHNTDRRTKV